MNHLVRWPRWVSVPLAVVVVVGVSVACYPGGVLAAYEDLRDSRELNESLNEGRKTRKALSADVSRLRDRITFKEELITALIRGEVTLATVTDEFAELNRADETLLSVQRVRYGDLPLEELTACNILDYVATRTEVGAGTSEVRNRVRAEFERRFRHPAPGGECGR